MLCKKCGAQIRREDKGADGLYRCPGCGAVYRPKSSAAGAEAAGGAKSGAHAAKPGAANSTAKAKSGAAASGAKAKSGARAKAKPGAAILARRRWQMLAVAAAAIVIVAVALGLTLRRGGGEDREAVAALASATATQSSTSTPEPTATPMPPASVHFRAVGDIMSHKLQLTHAKQKDGSYNYDSQFEYVKDALSKADYTIANLELSIAPDGEYSSYPYFRTPEAILETLKDCGVDMFTQANNHVLDGFWKGLTHTVDKVEEYGFDHLGAYRTAEEAQQPLVLDINGIRFGFLAYTKDLNDNDKRITSEQASFCVKRLDGANFKADVQALRDLGAEVVICLPHWGDEGRRSVPASCKKYAQQMVEAGVDIILGSHPHVVLPIEKREVEVDGKKKEVLVAWSMGNFISYMAAQYMDSGIIVDFTVTRDEQGEIHIGDLGYVPVYVWGNTKVFHLICSGDFYSKRPKGMSDADFKRMKQSVKEINDMIGEDGITMLTN